MSFIAEIAVIKPRFETRYRERVIDRYATVRGNVSDRPAFSQLWQCFAWAAVLGFIHDRRRPLEAPTGDAFAFSTIRDNGPLVFKALLCAALAKADAGIEVLRDPKEVIKLIEEYANGGFDVITELLDDNKHRFDAFDAMLDEVMGRIETGKK